MNAFWAVFAAVVPSVGVALLFWFAVRSMVNADRTERAAIARMDARDRAEHPDTIPGPPGPDS